MGLSESLPVKLNVDEKDELRIEGYRPHLLKCIITVSAMVLSLGLFFVILVWRKDLRMKLMYQQCNLQEATKIVVKDTFEQVFVEDVIQAETGAITMPFTRYFFNKRVKYVWDEIAMQFVKLGVFDDRVTCDVFHANPDGLQQPVIKQMEGIYGANLIEIVVLPVYKLIINEISNPFYLFQFYTVAVWMAQEYFDYSSEVVILTSIAVGMSVWETRKQMTALREKVQVTGTITVLRGGTEYHLLTTELVPGDVICINPSKIQEIQCDAVLIEGSCSIDESMLTGESYPITKMAVPNDDTEFRYHEHRRHLLFCGTQLIQGRAEFNQTYLKAVVIRTGYMTSKGELIRAILFPKPADFKFYQDILKCALLIGVFGLAGTIYSTYAWIMNGATVKEIILNSLDVASFVVPPILPAALTSVTAFAQKRLKQSKIFCLSAKHISQSGGVDVVCFDKTGTLTESEIELEGAIPIEEGEIREPVTQLSCLTETHPLLTGIASCHSLIRMNGDLNGYSIDQKMFQATEWNFKEGPTGVNSEYGIETPFLVSAPSLNDKREINSAPTTEVAVLKRFPFESSVKRMTVVTQRRGFDHFTVFIKGAPELIASLCDSFTIPLNYESVLKHYTTQGYRVLALAQKVLSPHLTWTHVAKLNREELEHQSELIGLLVVRNQLKVETIPTLRVLHEAQIGTVMVTGDNLQTAVTVAKECAMIDPQQRVLHVEAVLVEASAHAAKHLRVVYKDLSSSPEFINGTIKNSVSVHNGNYCFALDGKTFNALITYDFSLMERIVHRAKVFARMAPEDKQYLIEILQKIGRQVAMVGDGCNDCGALRTADAGISLSMADASVAAPFTSQETNISCVIPLLLEGRTTLEAVFATFLCATGTSFVLFIAILMLFSISAEPSDTQFAIWNFAIGVFPIFTIGSTPPSDYLHRRRPLRHLWAFLPLFSLFTFILWQAAILLIGWFYCHNQSWFEPYVFEPGRVPTNPCYEETTIFFLICIGTIVTVFVYAPDEPYSKRFYNNKLLMGWALEAVALTLCLMFITDVGFQEFINFKSAPHFEYNLFILLVGITGGLFCYIWEKYFIRQLLYQTVWPRYKHLLSTCHRYQEIEKTLAETPGWPKIGESDISDSKTRYSDIEEDDDSSSDSSSPQTPLRFNVGRISFKNKMTFRTFRGSKRGGYTVNGPKLSPDSPYEGVPTTAFQFIETMPELAHELRTSVVLENEQPMDEDLPLPPPPPSPYLFNSEAEEPRDQINQSEESDPMEAPYEIGEIQDQIPLEIIEEEESAPEEDDADEVDMEEAQLSLFPTLRRLSDLTFSQLELPIDLMRRMSRHADAKIEESEDSAV